MRDTRELNRDNRSDKEVFIDFKMELRNVMENNGYELKYDLMDRVAIPYVGGFLEIFEYDRPRNPRMNKNVLEFDWDLVGELRTIKIELI